MALCLNEGEPLSHSTVGFAGGKRGGDEEEEKNKLSEEFLKLRHWSSEGSTDSAS